MLTVNGSCSMILLIVLSRCVFNVVWLLWAGWSRMHKSSPWLLRKHLSRYNAFMRKGLSDMVKHSNPLNMMSSTSAPNVWTGWTEGLSPTGLNFPALAARKSGTLSVSPNPYSTRIWATLRKPGAVSAVWGARIASRVRKRASPCWYARSATHLTILDVLIRIIKRRWSIMRMTQKRSHSSASSASNVNMKTARARSLDLRLLTNGLAISAFAPNATKNARKRCSAQFARNSTMRIP